MISWVDELRLDRHAMAAVAATLAGLMAIGLTASSAPAAIDATPPGTAAHYTLANGLELVVVPDHRTPVVTHMIWYKVGSADEPVGKSGIAHFLEHLMFKGTAKNPAGRFSQTLATIGGQENAFTSTDFTAYFQRLSREHLSSVMEFEELTSLARDRSPVKKKKALFLPL